MTTTQTQIRRDTATNLAAATPAEGEPGYDKTNKRFVIGDGSTAGGIKHASAADVQGQTFIYPTVGGTGNAITLTNSVSPVASYAAPLTQLFKAGANNTTAVTVNVDGLGAKNVKKMSGGALAALSSGDIVSGGIYEIIYDGTQFQIQGIGASSGNIAHFNPADPSATSSTTPVMMGVGSTVSYTPVRGSKIAVILSGDMTNGGGIGSISAQIYFGTGSAPSNGAAATGTPVGNKVLDGASGQANVPIPFPLNAGITGLSAGTAYWIDIAVSNSAGNSASPKNLGFTIIEV